RTFGYPNMNRSCGADALVVLRASAVKLQGERGRPLLNPESRLFASGGAHATRILLIALLLLPSLAHAYAGPGAGFAVLSSFWAVFFAFRFSVFALVTWAFG